MIKIIFRFILIAGLITVIGACKSSDKSSNAATSTDLAGTGTTPSGTITGNDNLTGVFYSSWYGQEPSGGCIDNSSALSVHSYLASDTKSFKKLWIITGSSSFTGSEVQYSDTGCSTMTAYFTKMADNVTIGNALTGLTPGSSPAFPTSANKISYQFTKYSIFANTSTTISSYASRFGVTVTSGEGKLIDESDVTTEYNLIAAGDTACGISQTKKCLYKMSGSSADNYTDWISSDSDVYWQE